MNDVFDEQRVNDVLDERREVDVFIENLNEEWVVQDKIVKEVSVETLKNQADIDGK